MKKIFFPLLLMLISLPSLTSGRTTPKTIETPADDSRIEYTGRILKTAEGISYDWSGVYARIRFEGPSLAIRCSDTHGNWFNVFVDKEMQNQEDSRIFVNSKDTVIVLADGLKKGPHEIILQKRTEGEQGTFTLHSVITEKELLQADGRRKRHIEFIGDSYTCGYGTEGSNKSHFSPETENCNLTYAAIVSRYFDADYTLISHSGQGICRNYDDFRYGYNMPERYLQTFDEKKEPLWDPETVSYRPDVVVIYLCTNDFSTGRQPYIQDFCAKYIKLMKAIRKNYGEDTPIVCMASKCSDDTFDYIRQAAHMSGLDKIAYFGMTPYVHNDVDEIGSDYHPNYKGHRKVATSLIPYLSTITGWELEDKTIK